MIFTLNARLTTKTQQLRHLTSTYHYDDIKFFKKTMRVC